MYFQMRHALSRSSFLQTLSLVRTRSKDSQGICACSFRTNDDLPPLSPWIPCLRLLIDHQQAYAGDHHLRWLEACPSSRRASRLTGKS